MFISYGMGNEYPYVQFSLSPSLSLRLLLLLLFLLLERTSLFLLLFLLLERTSLFLLLFLLLERTFIFYLQSSERPMTQLADRSWTKIHFGTAQKDYIYIFFSRRHL